MRCAVCAGVSYLVACSETTRTTRSLDFCPLCSVSHEIADGALRGDRGTGVAKVNVPACPPRPSPSPLVFVTMQGVTERDVPGRCGMVDVPALEAAG